LAATWKPQLPLDFPWFDVPRAARAPRGYETRETDYTRPSVADEPRPRLEFERTSESVTIEQNLDHAIEILRALRQDADLIRSVHQFEERATKCLAAGGRILCCGNGGSLSQATHFAEEWTGRFRRDRPALPALALSDPAQMSCIANDFGFDQVFARQLEAHGRKPDLFVALSTSGNSRNVIEAARTARRIGIDSVALVGREGGQLAEEVDIAIRVPIAIHPDRIQECHLVILHSIIEAVERVMFPENYRRDAPEASNEHSDGE